MLSLEVPDNSSGKAQAASLTSGEVERYDRQIRLWGFQTQNHLRNSSILIAGLTGCGSEIAKNIMLIGVKSLTLLDPESVNEKDLYSNIFISSKSVGENRAEALRSKCQLLNPNVKLVTDSAELDSKDESFLRSFDLVILVDQKYSFVEKYNEICRKNHIKFIAGGIYGWLGYAFFDFNGHLFCVLVFFLRLESYERQVRLTHIVSYFYAHHESHLNINAHPFEIRSRDAPKIDLLKIDVEISESEDESTAKKRQLESNGNEPKECITLVHGENKNITMSFSSWRDAMNVDWSRRELDRKVKSLPPCYFPFRALLRIYDESDIIDLNVFRDAVNAELEFCSQCALDGTSNDELKLYIGRPLSPTCAIVGATIVQEVVKALSATDEPLENVFIYSAFTSVGFVCKLPP